MCLSFVASFKTIVKKENSVNDGEQQPYRLCGHPGKSALDEVIYFLFLAFCRLAKFGMISHGKESKEAMDRIRTLRQKCDLINITWMEVFLWNWIFRRNKDILMQEWAVSVPRLHTILNTASSCATDETRRDTVERRNGLWSFKNEGDQLKVKVYAPSHYLVLKDYNRMRSEPKPKTCAIPELETFRIDSSVQVMLWFWAGGCSTKATVGAEIQIARDMLISEMKRISKETSNRGTKNPNIMIISPEYRLAPENPFPACVIDALSVLSFIINATPSSFRIHIGGQSAGGYLAAVTTFEAHRRYPGRVKSAFVWDPMISPMADSMSYYLASRATGLSLWVQWSIRALFSLGDEKDKERSAYLKKNGYAKSYDDFVEILSNRRLVENSPMFTDNLLRRYCDPMNHIPTGLGSDNAAKFIISTATGDPLHDEGMEFAKRMSDQGAKVTFLESRSGHTSGNIFDRGWKKRLIENWRSMMFEDGRKGEAIKVEENDDPQTDRMTSSKKIKQYDDTVYDS